jgi:hypothetical protein
MQRGMKWSALFSIGVLAAGSAVWLHSRGELPSLPAARASAAVTVVLVGNRAALDDVRAAIARERIVADSADGFVLRERRIVAASAETVGELLGRAGWTDAKIEIVTVGAPSQSFAGGSRPVGAHDAELNELRAQETLSASDAARALQLLE